MLNFFKTLFSSKVQVQAQTLVSCEIKHLDSTITLFVNNQKLKRDEDFTVSASNNKGISVVSFKKHFPANLEVKKEVIHHSFKRNTPNKVSYQPWGYKKLKLS